jgi:hypothetical protein
VQVALVVHDVRRQIAELRDQLEDAFDEVVGRIDRVEMQMVSVRESNEAQAEAAGHLEGLSTVTLELLRGLIPVIDDVVASSHHPVTPVDLGPIGDRLQRIEDVAYKGSLHNAADIANLRREVQALAETVRSKDEGIEDLRATLRWIKERLLLR